MLPDCSGQFQVQTAVLQIAVLGAGGASAHKVRRMSPSPPAATSSPSLPGPHRTPSHTWPCVITVFLTDALLTACSPAGL